MSAAAAALPSAVLWCNGARGLFALAVAVGVAVVVVDGVKTSGNSEDTVVVVATGAVDAAEFAGAGGSEARACSEGSWCWEGSACRQVGHVDAPGVCMCDEGEKESKSERGRGRGRGKERESKVGQVDAPCSHLAMHDS